MPGFGSTASLFSKLLRREPDFSDIFSVINRKIEERLPLGDVLSGVNAARLPLLNRLDDGGLHRPGAKALALKLLNLLIAKHQFRSRSEALVSRPFGLVVDPANGCNLACPGCVHSDHSKEFKLFDWNKGLLTEDRFQALLERYGAYALQVMFCNYGEPTANLKTPKFIEMAKGYLISTALSTNLTVGRFDAESYVRSGLDFMFVSIDGATQPVYEQFRRNGNIELIFKNIEKLVAAKQKLGKRTPILRWQFLAFEHNVHEIPLALQRAKELGMNQFAVETPFDVSWDVPEVRVAQIEPSDHELIPDTEGALSQNFDFQLNPEAQRVIEREFDAGWPDTAGVETRPSEQAPHTCSWLYKLMVMDANGRILPCCAAPQPDVHLVFSNFPETQDSFNSATYRQARTHFINPAAKAADAGPSPHCEKCEWDQEHTEMDARQVALYLRTSGKGMLDPATIRILSDW